MYDLKATVVSKTIYWNLCSDDHLALEDSEGKGTHHALVLGLVFFFLSVLICLFICFKRSCRNMLQFHFHKVGKSCLCGYKNLHYAYFDNCCLVF